MVHHFKTSCQADHLKDIRTFVEQTLAKYSIDEAQINLMVLAVDEICTNRIKYGIDTQTEYCLEVRIENKNNQTIVFEIIDQGLPFDIKNYKEPSLLDIIKEKRKGGMGLMLVKRIMDDIEVVSANSNSIFRMQKKLQMTA